MPLILRKEPDRELYEVHGAAYVHGIMWTQTLEMQEKGLVDEEYFEIAREHLYLLKDSANPANPQEGAPCSHMYSATAASTSTAPESKLHTHTPTIRTPAYSQRATVQEHVGPVACRLLNVQKPQPDKQKCVKERCASLSRTQTCFSKP
jgi:hypothetical protein